MFANFLHLITGRPSPDVERSFITEVHTAARPPRNLRVERIILAGWLLIVMKSFFMIWLVDKYHLPFNANWVILPTVTFALLCTAVYLWRD